MIYILHKRLQERYGMLNIVLRSGCLNATEKTIALYLND